MTPPQLHIIEGSSVQFQPEIVDEKILFMLDMQATLRGERHGIMGAWQYSSSQYAGDPVRGAYLWEEFLKASKDYYPIHNEIRLIGERAGDLLDDNGEPITLADFGPGPAQAVLNKTLPVKRHFKNVVRYCPLDKCQDYLVSAGDVLNNDQPGIEITAFHADYFKDHIELPQDERILALFFGSTISNLEGPPDNGIPEQEIIAQLSRVRQIIGPRGQLLMAYDTNQDEGSILRSYLHPLQQAFGSNVMYRVKRDLPVYGNFDPAAWRYEPVWHEKSHQLCHTIVCERTQDFWLGGEYFNIEAGQRFILNNSFKYPAMKMQQWAQRAGFDNQRVVMDHQNRQALHLMAA